jgi:hypothetical protein
VLLLTRLFESAKMLRSTGEPAGRGTDDAYLLDLIDILNLHEPETALEPRSKPGFLL